MQNTRVNLNPTLQHFEHNSSLKQLEDEYFICENKYCVLNTSLCDGVNDCIDGSDEGIVCAGR